MVVSPELKAVLIHIEWKPVAKIDQTGRRLFQTPLASYRLTIADLHTHRRTRCHLTLVSIVASSGIVCVAILGDVLFCTPSLKVVVQDDIGDPNLDLQTILPVRPYH